MLTLLEVAVVFSLKGNPLVDVLASELPRVAKNLDAKGMVNRVWSLAKLILENSFLTQLLANLVLVDAVELSPSVVGTKHVGLCQAAP